MDCPWFTEARLREEDMDCPDLLANDPQALFFYILRMQAELCPPDHLDTRVKQFAIDQRSDHICWWWSQKDKDTIIGALTP